MKKNLQRFGASVLAAAMVAQSVALPAAAETTKIDSSVAQSVAASAASAASAVQSLPKFTSTTDLIKQTAQTLAAQGEVHELEQDDAKLEATAQSKAGMSLAALENALADAMYANAAAGKINTEAYGLNKDEMASVMAATIKTYHLSSAVTDLGYETNAAGVVTAVTFTGSSGMTSAMESMTNSDDEVIAQQADSYAQAYVAENSDTFAASAAADGHTYGEPKWYWNDTNPEDGHTHTWKETPDGYWTKTDDGWAYTAVYTCKDGDGYEKVEGTVTKETTDAKPGVAGKTVYSASVPADKSPVKKEYKEPTTRTDDIAALPCQSHAVPKDADGKFVVTFNWEMKKVEGELAADYSNAQLFYDSETGKISVGAPVTIDWECTSITFKCAVCGEEIKTQPVMTMPVSVVVDQNDNSVYINVGGTPTLDTTSGGIGVTLVSAMDGGNWYDMQNNPVDASKVNFTYQSGDNKGKNSLLLYDSQKTAVYVDDQGNQVTNTYDISTAQMNYYYFQLSQFNQDEAEYFGVAAPFWTSKGVQKQGEDGSITGTMGAIKVLCNLDPNQDVPPTTMAFMLNMLPQAFMSYVMNYGEALKGIRDAGLAQVAKLGDADYVTKLLILHDWISQVAEFDMGSMGDITTSGGDNIEPIQMTAFGALLGGEIGAKGVEYGCICLGYASAFNYMVQNLPDNKEIYKKTVDGKEVWKTPDEVGDNAVVDFAQVLYYCDTADTSVAGNAFGGGMFNNVHYFNAVKVNKLQGNSKSATMTTGDTNKNWYYVDVCYDDINTECMAQTRVENAGDLRHVNFLVSPSGLEGRYSKYYDYIDSLYDGYTYTKNKEPDVDDAGNVVMNNGKPHYSYTKAVNKNETRYTDTCYEDTWFTSICSPIYFDNNYFYYVDTTTNHNLYNNMRRQQAENGNSGNSGSGSSGNNSQMQQFMKKMQNQGPDTLEARPRTANYYIREEDSSSSGGQNFNMSSFTKTDDPYDIILMYYNDLKETSSDDSDAKVLAEAGTIYRIDTSATDKHAKVENNLNTECLADAAAKRIYPALVHSTALYDGKLYFNVNNAIYRMDPTTGAVEEVKEYNTVHGGIKLTKDKDGNMVPDTHFTGMSMVIMDSAQDTDSVKHVGTFKNHPLAGLTLRDSYSMVRNEQGIATGIKTTEDQLIVSVGTNLSNTYKELDSDGKPVVKTDPAGTPYDERKSYKTESWNYNPAYNQNMSSSDEKNKNEEFMWCANLVESMDMKSMVSDLSSGATTDISVEAWCDTPAYTQARTNKYGLTKGEKVYADDALPKGHTWKLNELETKSVGNDVYLCDDCHTATESTPHTVTLPDPVEGVTLTLGTTSNTYIKDDTVTLTVEKVGTDIVTVTAKSGDTDVTLTEVQEAAQDEAAAQATPEQATTEKAKTVYTFTMPDDDVDISVTKAAKTYAVNVATLTNGKITASAKEAAEKETVILTAEPATGYALKAGSVKVTYKDADNTDKTVEVKPDTEKANTYTFAMPAYPVNVSAEFVKEYKVTAAPAENGTVTVDPAAAVEGTDVTVTVKAADNYQLKADSLTYSYQIGEDKKTETLTVTDGKATFKMPAADVTVDAKFEAMPAKTYGITSDVTNGAAKLSVETAAVGDTVEVTFTANGENYELEESSVRYEKKDDSSIAKALTLTDDKYSFTMPDYDVVVKAVFAKTTHTVTCDVTNGTATVDPTGEIKEGTSVTVTFKPDEDKANYVLKENPKLDSGNIHTTLNVSNGVGTFKMDKNDVIITAEFVEPTTPSEGDNTSDNTNNGGEETPAIEAEERTAHGAAEKTTVTAMAVFTCTDKNCASAQFVDATVKQTSGVTTAAVSFNGKDYTAKYGEKNGWVEENGKKYWYENGVKQGTTGRGKEIYDPDSDAWYWLDAVQGGAMTVNKDVYQESAAGQWADRPDGTGKWVRYDENGHMIKGWQTTEKGTYYFDPTFGTMAKGVTEIDGVPCAFDQNTGIGLDKQWVTINGADYWYENGVRQGLEGRGKEIYDPASDAWYWLDSVDQGKKATSKDVYQESEAGQWADRADGTGKWVRYDAQGHMIKGWSADKRYYFDPIYGTMAKGDAVIDGRTYHFDKNTGIRQ